MALWQWLLDSAAAILLIVLLFGAWLVVRRRVLSRHGGTFELSLRVRVDKPGRGWVLGLGRYNGDQLEWFRIFSPMPGPKRSWHRSELSYASQRQSTATESVVLYAGHVIVECTTPTGPIELAMSRRRSPASSPGSRRARPASNANARSRA